MMAAAEGDGELVANLEAKPAGLRETKMVGVAGLASADKTALVGHEAQMGLVPQALCLRNRQHALVDAGMDLLMRWRLVNSSGRKIRFPWSREADQTVLKRRPDRIAIRRGQAVCLWPCLQRPGT